MVGLPGGPGPPPSHPHPLPDQITVAPSREGHGVSGGLPIPQRPFSQIITEESASRNIIQLHLRKIPIIENGKTVSPKNITFDQLGEFIFDTLKINPEDCLGLDLTTGLYDTRERTQIKARS